MNRKEIAEIRRRFSPDKNAVTCLRGCYVNANKQIVAEFNRSLLSLPQDLVYRDKVLIPYERRDT